jgi:predicted ATPase
LKAGVLAEPILVGREPELEESKQCLDSAIEGKGNTVFVSGEAGAGKTRLVNEFLKAVTQKGDTAILRGYCLGNVSMLNFPFIEAFNSYFKARNRQEGEPGLESDLAGTVELSSHFSTGGKAYYETLCVDYS